MSRALIKMYFFLFFTPFAFTKNLGVAPFDPEYENYLYSIYKKYHSQSLTREQWDNLIINREVNTYSIQKGDNLWDISQFLFGNPNYWPKLWSINADITNPHRVNINYLLQVVMGSKDAPPRAVIKADKSDDEKIDQISSEENNVALEGNIDSLEQIKDSCVQDYALILSIEGYTSMYDQKIKCRSQKRKIKKRGIKDIGEVNQYFRETKDNIPPPLHSKIFKNNIPLSLPPISLIQEEKLGAMKLGKEYVATRENILSNYLVGKNDLNIIGSIEDIPDNLAIVTSDLILELEVPVSSGEILTLIHPLKKIKSNNLSIRGPFGYEVIVQAIVEITHPVSNRSGMYIAKVKKIYSPVTKNAQIIQGTPASFNFLKSERRVGGVRAQIVGTPQDQSSDIITIFSFVYLNKGSSDNINIGDTLNIQSHPKLHDKISIHPLGKVVIVHTAQSVSTGFVTHLNSLSFLGDYVAPTAIIYADEAMDEVYIENFDDSTEGEDVLEGPDNFVEEEESNIEEDTLEEEDINEEGASEDDFFEEDIIEDEEEEPFEEEDINEEGASEDDFFEEDIIEDEEEEPFEEEDINEEGASEDDFFEEDIIEDEEEEPLEE